MDRGGPADPGFLDPLAEAPLDLPSRDTLPVPAEEEWPLGPAVHVAQEEQPGDPPEKNPAGPVPLRLSEPEYAAVDVHILAVEGHGRAKPDPRLEDEVEQNRVPAVLVPPALGQGQQEPGDLELTQGPGQRPLADGPADQAGRVLGDLARRVDVIEKATD